MYNNEIRKIRTCKLLHLLPVTTSSMDFIEGLMSSHGKDVLLVVVGKFSKHVLLSPASHVWL